MSCCSSKSMNVATKVKGGTTLLLIDVQKDFHPGGSLAIETAGEDADRIVKLIKDSIKDPDAPKINRIVASLDSHYKLHIAHPKFWESGHDGEPPAPFTLITSAEIKKGVWRPRKNLKLPVGVDLIKPSMIKIKTDANGDLDLLAYCIEYTRLLEEKGTFKLIIWPEHCLIGSDGHGMVDNVNEAFHAWADTTGGSVEFPMKGQNLLTEMYSCMRAEVPITVDTDYNQALLYSLAKSDRLLIAGQAESHCVHYSTKDIISRWPKNQLHKICVLKDCMSPVPGYEKHADAFHAFLKEKGIRVCNAADVFNEE